MHVPNLVYKKYLQAQKVRLHTKLFAELTQCTNLESINILTGNFSINIIIFRLLTVYIHFTFILGSKNNHSQDCQISVFSILPFKTFSLFIFTLFKPQGNHCFNRFTLSRIQYKYLICSLLFYIGNPPSWNWSHSQTRNVNDYK